MKKRDLLNSPRLLELKKRRRRGFLSKIFLYVLGIVVFGSALIIISRINKLNIQQIAITGNNIIETELIKNVIKDDLAGHYLYVLPKSNFLLFPKGQIKEDLTAKFKRLINISFALDNSGILNISLSEREEKYIWCGENLPTEEKLPCYFMDDSGYLFDEAPYFSGNVYFKFFGPVNDSYFAPALFNKIVSFKNGLEGMKINTTSVFVKPDGDIEIYLSASQLSLNTPKIILKNDFEVEKTLENLQAAMATDPLMSNFKNKYESMKYIDLRFGNKVYFKFE